MKAKTKAELAAEVEEKDADLTELSQANEEFNAENERLRQELAAAKASLAKNNPVSIPKRMESEEQQVGQDGIAKFEEDFLVKPATSTLDDPAVKSKIETLRFMEEPVTVEISEVADEDAEHAFCIEVNNDKEFFRRGERKTVRRKFIEGLARAKRTGYANKLVVDQMTGEKEYVYPAKTGLRYPFSVVEDRNPDGARWLKAVLRQP